MSDDNDVKLGGDLRVNEGTLELLRHRIEEQVRRNLFRSVGLPAGGLGLAAIVFGFVFYIPAKLNELVDQPGVQQKVEKEVDRAVGEYFRDKDGGQRFIVSQVERVVPMAVERAIDAYFTSPDGLAVLKQRLPAAAETYFASDAGHKLVNDQLTQLVQSQAVQKQIEQQVTAYLASEDARRLLTEAVNNAVRPKTAALNLQIQENLSKLVVATHQLGDVWAFEKGGLNELHQFLAGEQAAEIKKKKIPVALLKRMRRGQFFDENAIRIYIDHLGAKFGEQFRYVVFVDAEGDRFLWAAPPQAFSAQLNRGLMDVLNARPGDLSHDKAVAELRRLFPDPFPAHVRTEMKVEDALSSKAWRNPDAVDDEVTVLNSAGKPVGTTSRRRLIHGVLGWGA